MQRKPRKRDVTTLDSDEDDDSSDEEKPGDAEDDAEDDAIRKSSCVLSFVSDIA